MLMLAILFSACSDDTMNDIPDIPVNNSDQGLGWMADEDPSSVPNAINLSFGNSNLPSSVSLKNYTPPVGDQGQKGTCVAFALGYNLQTMLDGIDNNMNTNQLADPTLITSPTDLFLAIPNNQKGANCEGTQLHYAFEVMQNRGVATLDVAPYSDVSIGDCSQAPSSSAQQDAGDNKIEYYRQINITVEEFKAQLADNRPIGIGAFLSDSYMGWNSDDVLSSHTTYNRVGIHSGHAMTIVGYDDNKGPNGAFEVVNSWGDSWGNQGFIWIDYNFMTSGDFAVVAFIAENSQTQYDPNDPNNPQTTTGADVAPYMAGDYGTGQSRELEYDVYNIGSETVSASQDWTTAYILVNAFDVNDYHVVLWDTYTDDFGNPGEVGNLPNGYGQHNYYNYLDLPSGYSSRFAYDGNFNWSLEYNIPSITGYYYPALIADVTEVINESNEQNNVFILSDSYGAPIYIENGIPYGFKNKKINTETESQKVRISDVVEQAAFSPAPFEKGPKYKNAYRKDEVKEALYLKWKNEGLEHKSSKSNVQKH